MQHGGHGRQGLEARSKAGHMADTWRRMAADRVWRRARSGRKADARVDTWWTRFAGAAKVDTSRTPMVGTGVQSGHKAETWHGGQMVDRRQPHGGQALVFFPKTEPHSKLFKGEKQGSCKTFTWICPPPPPETVGRLAQVTPPQGH